MKNNLAHIESLTEGEYVKAKQKGWVICTYKILVSDDTIGVSEGNDKAWQSSQLLKMKNWYLSQ